MSDPVRYPSSQYLKVAGLATYLPLFPEISYGDKIVVEGTVNNGKLKNSKLVKIEDRKTFFSGIRNSIISFYQEVLPEPEGGLLGGIVIGAKGALSPDFYNQTKLAGVAHVVVASGANVTFVVSFLMGVLTLFLTRRKAIVFAIVGIILYLFISGFDAPLIRAAIMSSVLFLGQETGRLVSTWRVLFITAGLMLIYNPGWIVDIGFILSFVSTASLILFEKRIHSKLLKIPKFLREGLSTSLAAQIGVAPILFVTFGQFNIWSPLINALVLWTVPGIMIIGSIGGIVGLIFPFLGKLILLLTYPLLYWFVKIVAIFN
ncbi:MAG: ComEC/Rec2-related protein [Candidatus Woesebacteria bacterium GW2011_GWB1_39_10]|uniref:ComEC/Rec2-related protein n=2 Tax=Candidatus Woeseibacteriota TaxID=1752722 RepID=A0A0G0UUQ3_9BACT|nr:MAG: ComEC/Rec2-related protein [Candidatus Woesebacteria bacterium GW2011_GWB1_39_10]KKR92408.1 MAG: ComEC/Rec2-related protein [Candidatus Woesebacteria bacterium GW2011_GWA1_41_13b]